MFALKGAGASFGIVTEFLYKVYPGPETLPIYLLVWIEDTKDLLNLQEAAFNPHCPYSIVLNNAYSIFYILYSIQEIHDLFIQIDKIVALFIHSSMIVLPAPCRYPWS